MRNRLSTAALVLAVCATVLLVPGAAATTGGSPGQAIAASIRTALAAGARGDPLPRPLVNEKTLKKDVWQQWWTCAVDFDHVHGRICPLGDVRARRTVVVYGDSHAGMWLPALDRMGRSLGFRVVPLVKYSCVPFDVPQRHDGRPYASCTRFRRWAEQRIARIRPAMLLLGYRGFWAVDPRPGRTVARTWQLGTRTAVRRLVRHTRELVVLGDVSARDGRPRKCLRDPHVDMGTCTRPVEPTVLLANRITRAVAVRAHARYVTTQNLVCARGRCPLVVERIVTYRDPSHLSMTWTRRITPALQARIRPPG